MRSKRATIPMLVITALAASLGFAPLLAQTPKPTSYVGKALPELWAHVAMDSPWVAGKKPLQTKPSRGELSLVVFTSLD